MARVVLRHFTLRHFERNDLLQTDALSRRLAAMPSRASPVEGETRRVHLNIRAERSDINWATGPGRSNAL